MKKENLMKLNERLSMLSGEEKKLRDVYLRKLSTGEIQGPPTGYPSIDKPWLKYYPEDGIGKEMPEKSMFQYLIDSCKDRLNLVAVDLRMGFNEFDKSVRKLTYSEFIDEIITAACGLKSFGLTPKDMLVEILPNLIESRESIYAANSIGTTVYPISPMLPTTKFDEIITKNKVENVMIFGAFYEKFKKQLDDSKVKHIFYVTGLESLNPVLKKIVLLQDKLKRENKYIIPDDDRIVTWDKVLKEGKKYRKKYKIKTINDFDVYYKKDHIAVVVGTSGTTGIPKGACLRDYSLNACDFNQEIPKPFIEGEVNLDVLIQSISFGLCIMHHTMCGGLYNIIIPEMVTDKIGMLLKKFQPDHFSGGPIHYENILRSKEYKNGELKSPKNYLSGGASLSKVTERTLNNGIDEKYFEPLTGETKVFVRQGLGSTENSGTGIYTTRGSYKFGSVGIPVLGSNCSIFEQGTENELLYNEIGEIAVTGPTVMKEYLNNESETEEVLKQHSDGRVWLHLGDQGYMDKEGHVYMNDRYKNIFMRNGFNVHPSKIMELILSAKFVDKCFVIGVEHPVEMCVPVAFVILKEGANISVEDAKKILDEMCYNQLDEYFIPYDYVFVKEFPLNLGGKVEAKRLLEENNINYSNETVRKINLR